MSLFAVQIIMTRFAVCSYTKAAVTLFRNVSRDRVLCMFLDIFGHASREIEEGLFSRDPRFQYIVVGLLHFLRINRLLMKIS